MRKKNIEENREVYTREMQRGVNYYIIILGPAAHQEKDTVQYLDFQMHGRMCPSTSEGIISERPQYKDPNIKHREVNTDTAHIS